MKFGNLNFLEPSGPLQACNGTALPLPLTEDQLCLTDSVPYVISDFRGEVDANCVLLAYYAASSGNLVPTFLLDS